jgi:hypothetical protein
MLMRSCIERVARAASGSRLLIRSTASRKEEYGWHEGGLDLSSSWSVVPGMTRRDKTESGATLERMTKQRRAGRDTGGNEHRDQAKRASANAGKQEQPERESVVLGKGDEECGDKRATAKKQDLVCNGKLQRGQQLSAMH